MTRYTVVWVRSDQDELAELWLNTPNRDAVATAAHAIDQMLYHDAPLRGTELSDGLRSLFAPPVKAIFTVREGDRIAEVLRVQSV